LRLGQLAVVSMILHFAPPILDASSMKRRTQQVWFLALPDAEVLDVSGPWSVLGYANEVVGRELYRTRLLTASSHEVRTRHGLMLGGALSLAEAARLPAPDILVVAGAGLTKGLSAAERATASWLRKRHRRIGRIVSICTGAFILGEAGLLDRRHATTHWQYRDELRQRFPRAKVMQDDIYLRDGRVWTSAGITAGIDLMLALVEEDLGRDTAMTVAKALVMFLRRSGQQAQFSQMLARQEREPPALQGLIAAVAERLDKPLGVEALAEEAGMSARTLTRVCARELGETPAALVRRLRLEEARRLLEETALPLKAVARRAGVGDESTLWRLFTRSLGVTPAEYRTRFAAKSIVASNR
jgi:transcriptional regulator GlxA family with amidase domain